MVVPMAGLIAFFFHQHDQKHFKFLGLENAFNSQFFTSKTRNYFQTRDDEAKARSVSGIGSKLHF